MNQPFPLTLSFSYSEKNFDVNLIQLRRFQKAKIFSKQGLSLLPETLRILESGQRTVLSSLRNAGRVIPTRFLVLGNCFVTIVAAQLLQFGIVFQQ